MSCGFQVVVMDGGEYVSMAGEFNEFRKVIRYLSADLIRPKKKICVSCCMPQNNRVGR
jgi:hypothetical protein